MQLDTAYTEGAYRWARSLPHLGHCAGTPTSAATALALIASYLFLFINFYMQTYKKPVAAPAATAKSPKSKKTVRTHKRAASSTSMAARLPSSH